MLNKEWNVCSVNLPVVERATAGEEEVTGTEEIVKDEDKHTVSVDTALLHGQ